MTRRTRLDVLLDGIAYVLVVSLLAMLGWLALLVA
jgi:hypothetical protein